MDHSISPYRLLTQLEHFLLIDKAPGVAFHQQDGRPGLAEQLRRDLCLSELYPVHRLDTPTSGLLLFARTPAAASALGLALQEHRLEKWYLALSDRQPRRKQGWIRGDMQKSRDGQWRLSREQQAPAVTWFISGGTGIGGRAFLLRPHTGKTHQLRVALKSEGSPILGDTLYGGATADRLYLHAWRLQFTLFGEQHSFTQAPSQGQLFTDPSVQQWLAERAGQLMDQHPQP